MNIQLHVYTREGGRENNEDCAKTYAVDDYCMAIVCDGLGGQGGGEMASATAVECIMNYAGEVRPFSDEQIISVLTAANDAVVNKQKESPELARMKTTAAGCVIKQNRIKCFNVGDSRVYFFKNRALKYISRDHSVPQMSIDMNVDSFDSIRFNADRNRLVRVLGDEDMQELNIVMPEFNMEPGDAFMICSDGLWEYIYETEMEIDLSKSQTAKEWVDYMLVRLLLRAPDDNDNYTVIAGIAE